MQHRIKQEGSADLLVVVFLVVLLGSPFFFVAYRHKHEIIPGEMWMIPSLVFALFLGGFAYAWVRCGTEKLPFWRGLTIVASSKSGGTVGFSALFVLPTLAIVYLRAVLASLLEDIRGPKGYAASRFYGMVARAHENRFVR